MDTLTGDNTTLSQRPTLDDTRRLVIKIGSALLVRKDGRLRQRWLHTLAQDLATRTVAGKETVIVSSGAVALGRHHLGLAAGRLRLEESQAAAAAGQSMLMGAYQKALARYGVRTGQILLTMDDTERRRSYLNTRETVETLLALKAVPVVNENDSITTEEIRFGDNDRLAARVAQMIEADILVLFSDVNGLYTSDPARNKDATLIREIDRIDTRIERMAGPALSQSSSGGMTTKLMAAKIALAAGCRVAIACGRVDHPLTAIDSDPEIAGTWFLPHLAPRRAHVRWIASAVNPAGSLVIDAGAAHALRDGKSLLPPGVTAVKGHFERGDVVDILDSTHHALGRGIVAYGSDDVRKIMGHKTGEIERILGYRGRVAVVHRNHLALG